MYYTSKNKRAVIRHPGNDKGVDAVAEEWADRLVLEGVQEIWRGRLILQSQELWDV